MHSIHGAQPEVEFVVLCLDDLPEHLLLASALHMHAGEPRGQGSVLWRREQRADEVRREAEEQELGRVGERERDVERRGGGVKGEKGGVDGGERLLLLLHEGGRRGEGGVENFKNCEGLWGYTVGIEGTSTAGSYSIYTNSTLTQFCHQVYTFCMPNLCSWARFERELFLSNSFFITK